MLNKEQLQIIEREIRFLLERMGEQGQVRVTQREPAASLRKQADPPQSSEAGLGGEPTVEVAIRVEEPKMIIGERGQTLFELQHILKLILRKKIAEPFYLSLDVNDYKKNKEEYLQDLAQTTADEVALLKKPKELPPMPSSERRVVHMALSQRSDVVSESVGEGPDRRIVIRLKT